MRSPCSYYSLGMWFSLSVNSWRTSLTILNERPLYTALGGGFVFLVVSHHCLPEGPALCPWRWHPLTRFGQWPSQLTSSPAPSSNPSATSLSSLSTQLVIAQQVESKWKHATCCLKIAVVLPTFLFNMAHGIIIFQTKPYAFFFFFFKQRAMVHTSVYLSALTTGLNAGLHGLSHGGEKKELG